ncbi:MAG: hypothetical protein WBC22_14190 [Sedimentisphaerales bacterium]
MAVAATARKQEIGQEDSLQFENGGRIEDRSTVSDKGAGNSRCHICHINCEEGRLAMNHELGDISCEGCDVIV